MNRARINVAAHVPESGASVVSANVISIWDEGAGLADIEEAIKQAARAAILRARDVHDGSSRPCTVSTGGTPRGRS